jgi:hypothetical protein
MAMKLSLVRVERRLNLSPAIWCALIAWSLLVGISATVSAKADGRQPPTCIFRATTGMPCPTCGSTRAVLALAGGRPIEAFMSNPLVLAFLIGFGLWLGLRLFFGRAVVLSLSRGQAAGVWIVAALALLANWAWVLWREGFWR